MKYKLSLSLLALFIGFNVSGQMTDHQMKKLCKKTEEKLKIFRN